MGTRLTTGSGGEMGYETDHGKRRENVPETDHGQRRGQGATPAAFYLGLCRLRGILSPPASATVILQSGNSSLPTTILAVILNSGPEIKNHCSP